GPDQSLENPLGVGGPAMFDWFFHTKTWQGMHEGQAAGGETGRDDELAAKGMTGLGARIPGRNMVRPHPRPWPRQTREGAWGGEGGGGPPPHVAVFVLTPPPRAPIWGRGGAEFRFAPDGIYSAPDRGGAAAGDKDVRLGGGVSTIRQYLQARLVDELHL